MKLIRLKITDEKGFRSLQKDFEIYFLREFDYANAHKFNPQILAGRNGSGKSNILEALANIFYHLDCMYSDYLPDGFLQDEDNPNGFDSSKCIIDAFELEFFTLIDARSKSRTDKLPDNIPMDENKFHFLISKRKGEIPKFEWLNIDDYSSNKEPLTKQEIQSFLPDYVLGYSSGENEILSLPFFKTRFLHFDEYADKLSKEESFGFPIKSEGRLIYLDNEFSQAILITNLLMQKEDVLTPLKQELKVNEIDEFRLIICQDKYIDFHEDILRETKRDNKNDLEIELTSNLDEGIKALKRCATCYHEYYPPLNYGEVNYGERGRKYLILDYKVNEATKEAFKFFFLEKPLQLFQVFQLLLELNAHIVSVKDKKTVYQSNNLFINQDIYPLPLEKDRILRFKNFKIKKEGIDESILTKQLSDGEHQLLHSLGMALLFKEESCLFLLDEPETHFNPDWKAQFISSIHHCFSEGEAECVMREMLITTHSPYPISDSDSKYVHVFEKDYESQVVTCYKPDFQTLGASVNKITIQIFKTPITIGNYALEYLEEINRRFENGEDSSELIKELEENLGDSVEKTLLIHKLEA